MKILIDTNIVIDLILEREPFVEQAIDLFQNIEQSHLEGYITATTITNIFYIIRKTEGREVALAAIDQFLSSLQLCLVDRQTIETALSFNLNDFEDGVQLACATLYQLDGIVTRDREDFLNSPLPLYSPTELLNQLQ